MSTSKRNKPSPNKTPDQPNKPRSQAECYQEAWNLCLNKLGKEEREALLINLRKPLVEILGVEYWPKETKTFVQAVAELGEGMFEALAKTGHKVAA